MSMHLSAIDARALAIAVARNFTNDEDDAGIIADHVVDAELRGQVGLARLIPIAKHQATLTTGRGEISVSRDKRSSALIDGGHQPGMIVAQRATELAIDK